MSTINNYEHYGDCTIIDKNRMIHHTNCPHYNNNSNNITVNNNQRIRIKRPKSALGPFFQQGTSFNFTNIVPSGITQSTSYSSSNSSTTPTSSSNNSGHNSFFKQISHKQDKYSYFSKKDEDGNHNSESKPNRSSSTSSSSSNSNSNNLNSSYMALKKNFKLGSSSIQAPLLNKNFHNFSFLNPNHQVKNQNHKIYLFNRQRYFI